MLSRTRADDLAFTLLIAVHDEEPNIAPLCAEIAAALAGREDYEVLFVDDGSNDGTLAELDEVRGAGTLPVRVVRHRNRAGKSAALLSGAEAARGTWLVTMDGDCQNDPADVDTLFAALEGHSPGAAPSLVCGHRTNRRDPWIRRISSRIANGVRARLLDDGTPDTACGLKLIRRETFLALPAFTNMHRFLPALVKRSGGAVVSVSVNHRPRLRGQAKYGLNNRLWVGIFDLLGVMWLAHRPVPRDIEETD